MFKIIRKRVLTPVTKLLVIDAPLIAQSAKPGHFVIVRAHKQGERIPITITDYSPQDGTVTIVIQEVGRTSKLVGALNEGEYILDFVGPLGKAPDLPTKGWVTAVGGGFGAAAIYSIVKEMHSRGIRVTVIVGARTKDLLILEEELRKTCAIFYVCTDDGSKGYHGFVTGKLEQLIKAKEKIDEIIAIGPMPMMRAVSETTKPYKIPTVVSLDPIMVDGTGMCGACRVTVAGVTKFACVDGPFFNSHEVDFDEGVKRSKMYTKEQELSLKAMEAGKNVS